MLLDIPYALLKSRAQTGRFCVWVDIYKTSFLVVFSKDRVSHILVRRLIGGLVEVNMRFGTTIRRLRR